MAFQLGARRTFSFLSFCKRNNPLNKLGISAFRWLGTSPGKSLTWSISLEHAADDHLRLGVKTRIFHLGDYRRATVGPGESVPEDYFFPNASPASVMLRQKILKKCREDIYAWLNHENGQVAIYDAVNPTAAGRRALAKEFAKHDVQVSVKLECQRSLCFD